jgi:hypothetical protein
MRIKILALVFGCVFISCGSQSLTRGKAKDIIEATPAYQPQIMEFLITKDVAIAGQEMNFWVPQRGAFQIIFYSLTDEGKKYFSSIKPGVNAMMYGQNAGYNVTPTFRIRRRVKEVTGITDFPSPVPGSGGMKVVQYNWIYDEDSMPSEVRKMFASQASGIAGEALFRLYDDGWRLEEFTR